jgi:hypothetical protein
VQARLRREGPGHVEALHGSRGVASACPALLASAEQPASVSPPPRAWLPNTASSLPRSQIHPHPGGGVIITPAEQQVRGVVRDHRPARPRELLFRTAAQSRSILPPRPSCRGTFAVVAASGPATEASCIRGSPFTRRREQSSPLRRPVGGLRAVQAGGARNTVATTGCRDRG